MNAARLSGISFLLALTACATARSIPSSTLVSEPPTTGLTVPATSPTTQPEPTAEPRPDWFLVWTSARLPPGFGQALGEIPGMDQVSVVWAGNAAVTEITDADGRVVLQAPDGFWYPLELQWINPATHAEFAPRSVASALAALGQDEVLLSESSAELRGIRTGAAIKLQDGTVLTVAGVVADRWVGAAELAMTSPAAVKYGAEPPRYAIVRYSAGRAELEAALAEITTEPVRVRAEGEIPVLRHADAVRSQVDIKKRFGEFALRPREGRAIEMDNSWVDRNIVNTDLPLLGAVSCHRDFADSLRQVMRELEASGLGHLVDPAAFLGCWNPRFISGRRDLSRHAWGVAADINFGNPETGPGSPTAPELTEAMERAGITSGKDWLNPDPGHFEWYGADS